MFNRNRMTREKSTLNDMIKIYCNGQHQSKDDLCIECRELLDYAIERIENVRSGKIKPLVLNVLSTATIQLCAKR